MTFLLLSIVAALLAWRDRRLMLLAVAYSAVVALSLMVLPAYVGTGLLRYAACAQFETVLILLCLLIRHPAGISIAGLCAINILWNWLAATDFAAGVKGPYWSSYREIILMSQWGQIAALILFGPIPSAAIERAMFWKKKSEAGTQWTARITTSG